MILTPEIQKKIEYLCRKISNIEWSGALFYEYEGSFDNNDLVIKCHDLYLMDIGNAAYTEWEVTPEVANYMANNPVLLTYQLGAIHSHHSMTAFFSGTDTNTLLEQGSTRNNFVSLIVNNDGKYKAAITRKIISNNVIRSTYSIPFFGTEGVKNKEVSIKNERTIIEYFYLDIVKECPDEYQELQGRIDELKAAKNATAKQENSLSDHTLFDFDVINREGFGEGDFSSYLLDSDSELVLPSKNPSIPRDILEDYIIDLISSDPIVFDHNFLVLMIRDMPKIFSQTFGEDPYDSDKFQEWKSKGIDELVLNLSNDFGDEYTKALKDICAILRSYFSVDNPWLTDITFSIQANC